ncbi:hypothetical protein DFH11DRAFT_1594743 [Phellopilus nigrolimitatus]|nr:hypothetical protein DFH11DRAFT_1594743 [Phellopilus nigrolimitatus]
MPHTQSSVDHWQESDRKKKYKQPSGLVSGFIWRIWIWTETTFALSLMEPWEIILIFIVVGIMTMVLTVGLVRYFPHTIMAALQRAQYYFSGSDSLVKSLKDEAWASGRIEL